MRYRWYRFKWWLTEKFNIRFKSPLHLDLELTNQCNLKCIMCPHGDENWKPVKGFMDWTRAYKALIEGADMKIPSVKFNFRGEGSLNTDLYKYVQIAKELHYTDIQINTNLVAMSPRRIKEVCDAGLTRMIISIDGATKQTYERVRVGSSWHKLIRNLNYLHSLKKKPKIRIQMTTQGENEHEINTFKRRFSKYGDVLVKPVRTLSGERKRCPQPSQRIVIGFNGTVFGCCGNWNDEYPVGRFPDQTLREIWENQRFRSLRTIAKDPTQADPCLHCDVGGSYK